MSPFGFIVGSGDEDTFVSDGEVWKTEWESDRYNKYRDNMDEYGMPHSPWEYTSTPNTDWW